MNDRRPGPSGPPWSTEDLADFHADAFDVDTMARLRPLIMSDPEAVAFLAELDEVVALLGESGADEDGPVGIPMPLDVEHRLMAAIENESAARAASLAGGAGAASMSGPPWSRDDLADLHAGVFDPAETAALLPVVRADPEAAAYLRDLDAVTASLAALGASDQPVEPPRMPLSVEERLAAVLAAESANRSGRIDVAWPPVAAGPPADPLPAGVSSMDARRRRRTVPAALAAAAAAAVVVVVSVGVVRSSTTGGTPVAVPAPTTRVVPGPTTTAPPVVTTTPFIPPGGAAGGGVDLTPPVITAPDLPGLVEQSLSLNDYGPLGDPAVINPCLAQLGKSGTEPVGARQVVLDGTPAVVLVFETSPTAYEVLAVPTTCGTGTSSSPLATVSVPR